MSEDRGFEVRDKRRVHAPEDEPENGSGSSPDEEYEGGMPSMDITVQGVLRFSIEMLSTRAWTCMGLTPNPMTGKIERDLDEARRAIDVLGALAPHAELGAEPQEKRDLRNMLADLRVNFLRQSGSSG